MALINAKHLAPAQGFFEPQRTYNWTLEVPLDEVGDQLLIMQSLESFQAPKETSDVIELHHGNEVRKVAGKTSFSDLTLTLKDFVDMRTAEAVIRWRRRVYSAVTGSVGLARDYKKNGTLALFAPDISSVRLWNLQGLWPSFADYGDLNMTSPDKVMLSITLQVDVAVPGSGFNVSPALNAGLAALPL